MTRYRVAECMKGNTNRAGPTPRQSGASLPFKRSGASSAVSSTSTREQAGGRRRALADGVPKQKMCQRGIQGREDGC